MLKSEGLIEEAWILLRACFSKRTSTSSASWRNDGKEMTRRYVDASMLDKIKYLREVRFFEGTSLADQCNRSDWEKREAEIIAFNVLISGLLSTTSTPAQAVERAISDAQLLASTVTLRELMTKYRISQLR